MRELFSKRHPPLCAALDLAKDMVRNGELSDDEASALYRLLARDHALNCMDASDHAEARKPGGLVDRLGKLEKLSADDEELARRAERKVAVNLLGLAVDGDHVDAKTAREALSLLVDVEDHDTADGDPENTLASLALMSFADPESIRPAKSSRREDRVSPQEAAEFNQRKRR